MLFSRLKTKTDKPLSPDELDQETIARWKAIAAESREEASYKTITLDKEAVLPNVRSYQDEHSSGAQLSFDNVERVEAEDVDEGPEAMKASWPSAERESSIEEPEMYQDVESRMQSASDSIAFVEDEEEDENEVESYDEQFSPEIAATTFEQRSEPSVARADLSLSAEEDIKRRFGDNIRSALGPGTVIDGTFRFDNPVCVDGTLTGEVCSSSALIVGPHATIDASVIVGSLIVQGTIIGDIEADDLVEIRAGAEVRGNIETRRIVMEDGAVFNGKCRMIE